MKSLTSILGWAFLLAVLAVPSFLFYNWWDRSRQQSSSEIMQGQSPANIFPSSETARPAPPAGPAQQSPAVPGQPAAKVVTQPAPPQPAQLISSAPVQLAQPVTGALQTAPGQSKPVSYYAPKGDRDPTFSPQDYSRIKEEELRRLEEERQRRLAESRKPKEAAFESRLRLQGIIGSAAIINGEMYSAGQTIYGAKILKVGANYVIGEYKGRKFRKVLH